MLDNKAPSLKDPEILFLSFFGIGFIPFAPGTFGSIATLPFLYMLGLVDISLVWIILGLILITLTSCFAAEKVQKRLGLHDPGWIVIDEVIGMGLTWCVYPTSSVLDLFIMFLLFRGFDIFKLWPATFFDQKIKHGSGTILDDVISGLYAGFVFYFLKHFSLIA